MSRSAAPPFTRRARGSAFVALARRLVPWMVNPIHSVEQEAALQEIEAGRGDDAAYVAEVMQRTQETLLKLKAAGDSTRIEDAPEPTAKGGQGIGKRKPTEIQCDDRGDHRGDQMGLFFRALREARGSQGCRASMG